MGEIVYNKNGISFDIDAIATDLNGKMDKDGLNATCSVCVESYHDNDGNWYRIYNDGWCEQGGILHVSADNNTYQVALLQSMANANYFISFTRTVGASYTGDKSSGYIGDVTVVENTVTTTSFYIARGFNSPVRWMVVGYIR